MTRKMSEGSPCVSRRDYVEGHSVIQRLNEALEGAWSFEIVQHEVREDEVLVLGQADRRGPREDAVRR